MNALLGADALPRIPCQSTAIGASALCRQFGTVASHNPLAYQARATGDFTVNGTHPFAQRLLLGVSMTKQILVTHST